MENYKIFEIYPNFNCNQRCIHCFNNKDFRKKPELKFNEVVKVLYKTAKEGYNWLSILGGEPTIYNDLIRVIKFAKKAGYKNICIFTNGQKLALPNYVKQLKEAGLTHCNLSVFGHKPQLHEVITTVKGSFDKIIAAIENLKKNKIGINVIITVNKVNYKYLKEIFKFYHLKGINRFMIFSLKYQGRLIENIEITNKFMIKVSKAFSKIDDVINFCLKNKIPLPTILHIPPCIIPKYYKHLDNYNPTPSSMLLQDRERYEFKEKAYKGFIFKKSCQKCVFYNGCSGIDKEYSKIFGTKEFTPIKKFPKNPL